MEFRRLEKTDEVLLEQLVDLGTKNSKTLGHFPRGAFIDHASKGLIFGAVEDGNLCGYLLFRVGQKKQIVNITQLCINDKYRGQGVAKDLLKILCSEYKKRLRGISLWCREDYDEASMLWESFGFKAVSKRRGRGKKETTLVKWWYDFGNPDLFSGLHYESDKVKIVLDANIIIKLRGLDSAKGEEKIEIRTLDAPWVYDLADFYFAPETFNEINRDKKKDRAKKTRSFIRSNFTDIRFDPERRDLVERELRSILPGDTINDRSDRIQIAECVASSFEYFLTLDDNILSKKEVLFDQYNLKVFRPLDLYIHLDKLKNSGNYESLRIEGSNFTRSKIQENEIDQIISEFLRTAESEKKKVFKGQLLNIASDVSNSTLEIVKNNDQLMAVIGYKKQVNNLEIQVLRTNKQFGISSVLFEQLVVEIIKKGIELDVESIIVSEAHISQNEEAIFLRLGFTNSNNLWKKVIQKGYTTLNHLFNQSIVRSSFSIPNLKRALESSSENERENLILNFEQKLWPVKIEDIVIPTYIVPIKPRWAADLFDYKLANENLFGASVSLIWSNENVYYRNVNPVSELAPGRILWYASSGSNKFSSRKSGIIAASYLSEVHIGEAKKLFKQFKNYGVYDWSSILKLAKGNPNAEIKVLKFSFTEVFERIIRKDQIDQVFEQFNKPRNNFIAPLKVENAIFKYMYNIGANNE